jgi:hypothetical protein
VNQKILFIAFIICCFCSCKEGNVAFQSNNCKANPAFIRSLSGFNPAKSYFSTSEVRKMGLVLVENSGVPGRPSLRYYQHPSWRKAGWLASILLDETGSVYTTPAPFINILDNSLPNQNTVYRVDGNTGFMDEFVRLPLPDSITVNNAYGIIGMAYLCEAGVLYVSTVMGSDRFKERGALYAIDVKSKKIIDKIAGKDILGMGISYISGQRRLYFGTGRNLSIFSVLLTKDGRFSGDLKEEFSLAGLGSRGDDKVRRIRTDGNGNLLIFGVDFNYNLIAPREKQETLYYFVYNEELKQWLYKPDSKFTSVEGGN